MVRKSHRLPGPRSAWIEKHHVDPEFDADPNTDAMLAELSALPVERGPFVHPEAT